MTAPTSRTPFTETAAPPQRKALNPIVKFALELGPLALFFIVFSRLGIFAATAILMASVMVTLAVSYAVLKRIPIMPLVTAVIVLIFGSLTLIFHDETLIKIKPTALYLLFGAALFVGPLAQEAAAQNPVRRRAARHRRRMAQAHLALGVLLPGPRCPQ